MFNPLVPNTVRSQITICVEGGREGKKDLITEIREIGGGGRKN